MVKLQIVKARELDTCGSLHGFVKSGHILFHNSIDGLNEYMIMPKIVNRYAKNGLPQTYNWWTLMIHNIRTVKVVDLKFGF